MDRRDFIKITAAAGLGLSLPQRLYAVTAQSADLAVVSGPSPRAITRAAVGVLGGMRKFVSRGDVVVVKPNIGWDRLPEQAANTNPEVVAEVVRMCLDAGAAKVRVFDRPVNDPRRCYMQSGIQNAAKAAGANVSHIDERKFREMNINGRAMKTWPMYTEIMEADKVINVPVAKHHGLAQLTMGMKNWMGVMGGARNRIHQRIDESLVDLAMFVRPVLTVLDAIRILVANGPQGGSLKDVRKIDTVVAGADQVAVDSFGATLFGLKGLDLGYVKIAERDGLGIADLGKLEIKYLYV
jgi:uncharacterized protein (DUF362 family)